MYCIEQCDTFFYHAIGTSTGKLYPLCLLSIKAKKCGGYFFSDSGFFIENPKRVSIGKNCSFNRGVFISATNEITIGDNVLIGPYCVLRDANHIYANRSIPIREQGHTDGKIVIGDDVWLGSHVVVLRNVTIGSHSVIAAHSLVNKPVPSYEVWGGIPAKYIKKR
ncbi:MAG: acyltransferase, partial [Candidatus Micrarchaeia archaeon]